VDLNAVHGVKRVFQTKWSVPLTIFSLMWDIQKLIIKKNQKKVKEKKITKK